MPWIVCDQQSYSNNFFIKFFIKFFYKALKSRCCRYLAIAVIQCTYYESLRHSLIPHQSLLADIQVVYEDTRWKRHLCKGEAVE